MRRPISHFVDLQDLAAAHGFAARSFVAFPPPAAAETLDQLDPTAVLAYVFDGAGRSLDVTAAMLREHVAATVPAHARRFAGWLAVAHLRALATNPAYLA